MSEYMSYDQYREVSQDIDAFYQQFTEDDLERAEFYEINFDPIKDLYEVSLFDSEERLIRTVNLEDYDAAVAVLDDEFELEDLEDYSTED